MITLEESILFDKFTPGRKSYKGFNPTIETINAERKAEFDGKRSSAKRVRQEDLVVPAQLSSANKVDMSKIHNSSFKSHKAPQTKKPRNN